jgi:glycerol-3-phosphate cytidylyltransferase-like family protein
MNNSKNISLKDLCFILFHTTVEDSHKLIFTFGVFDVLHNVENSFFLARIKKLGESGGKKSTIIVGIYFQEIEKYSQDERIKLLQDNQFVDYVMILKEGNEVDEAIRELRPHIIMKPPF